MKENIGCVQYWPCLDYCMHNASGSVHGAGIEQYIIIVLKLYAAQFRVDEVEWSCQNATYVLLWSLYSVSSIFIDLVLYLRSISSRLSGLQG